MVSSISRAQKTPISDEAHRSVYTTLRATIFGHNGVTQLLTEGARNMQLTFSKKSGDECVVLFCRSNNEVLRGSQQEGSCLNLVQRHNCERMRISWMTVATESAGTTSAAHRTTGRVL